MQKKKSESTATHTTAVAAAAFAKGSTVTRTHTDTSACWFHFGEATARCSQLRSTVLLYVSSTPEYVHCIRIAPNPTITRRPVVLGSGRLNVAVAYSLGASPGSARHTIGYGGPCGPGPGHVHPEHMLCAGV